MCCSALDTLSLPRCRSSCHPLMIPTQYTTASLKCALHSDMFKQDGWHILTSVCGRNALITSENSHLASCRQKAIRHGCCRALESKLCKYKCAPQWGARAQPVLQRMSRHAAHTLCRGHMGTVLRVVLVRNVHDKHVPLIQRTCIPDVFLYAE